jgi:hypothetical protein
MSVVNDAIKDGICVGGSPMRSLVAQLEELGFDAKLAPLAQAA